MENTIPRNVTNYLLKRTKEQAKIWSLKTSIGDINGVFNKFSHSSEHNLYKLKIELDIFPDGDAYFFNREDEDRKNKMEEMLKDLIKPVVKKSYSYMTNSLIIIFISNDKDTKKTELYLVIKKIMEFISKEDVVRSMDINLRNRNKALIVD